MKKVLLMLFFIAPYLVLTIMVIAYGQEAWFSRTAISILLLGIFSLFLLVFLKPDEGKEKNDESNDSTN